MRHCKPLIIAILVFLTVGCAAPRMSEPPPPPIDAVPLGSFVAFDTAPQVRELAPGGIIGTGKWAIVVPGLLNHARSWADVDWFVLPYEADSRELCKQEASVLTNDFDGDANVALCIRSDGSGSFATDSDLL
jgi:hypothetical protein